MAKSIMTVVIPAHTVIAPMTVEVPARTLRVAVDDGGVPPVSALPEPLLSEAFNDPDLTGRGWIETTPEWPFVTDEGQGASRQVLRQQFIDGKRTPVGTRWAARKRLSAHVTELTHVIKIKPLMLQSKPTKFSNHFFGTINDADINDAGQPTPKENAAYLYDSSGRWYMDLHDDKYCGSLNAKRVGATKWPKFYSPAGTLRQGVWNQIITHFKHNTVGTKDGIYRTSVRYLEAGVWSSWLEIIDVAFGNFIVAANRNSKQSWVTIEGYADEPTFTAEFLLADLDVYPGDQYEPGMVAAGAGRVATPATDDEPPDEQDAPREPPSGP